MFKHILAALAAACLLLVVLWALGAPVPPRAVLIAAVVIVGLWSAWPLLRHIRGRIAAFLGLGFLAISLSACAGGLPGTGGTNFDINAFLNSTSCAHDDKVQGVTGAAGIPASLQFSAERHCPAAGTPAAGSATPPSQ